MTGARVIVWEPDIKEFVVITLEKWLDSYCETHSLVIIGRAGAGKSKLMHMLAWELCVGKAGGCTEYVFTKASDPLGVLSHSGFLRRAGCIVLTDFTLKTGRNVKLDDEELKSLLDVVEGGTIQSTRYRAAVIDPGLPRVIAVNTGGDSGSSTSTEENFGAWFAVHGQHGIAELLNHLGDLKKATKLIDRMSDDEVAFVRRVAIMLVDPTMSLITPALLGQLKAGTASSSADRKDRRTAFWSSRG